MEFLLILLGVVLILTVVGHGLWVMFAAFFSAVFGRGERAAEHRPGVPASCAGCGHALGPWERVCHRCGLLRHGDAAAELRELDSAGRTVRALASRKDVDPETAGRLFQSLAKRRRAVLGERERAAAPTPQKRATPPPSPRPAIPPVVPGPPLVPPLPAVEAESLPLAREVPPEEIPILELDHAPASRPAPEPAEAVPMLELADAPETAPRVNEQVAAAPPEPPSAPARTPRPGQPRRPLWEKPKEKAAPPRPPRRAWTDVFAGFMEEKNILWGELVGGLLIVGCSIALVITLWQTLKEQYPLFPFVVFSSVSVALFGAGYYTLHHWKLESTSRGLLVISTLLVPLNLLVLAGLSAGRAIAFIDVATTVAWLAIFLGMVWYSGKVVGARWLLALGVVGAGASQLLVPHLLGLAPAWNVVLLGCVPVACHVIAAGGRLRLLPREGPLTEREVHPLLVFLGMVAFALAVALGFLLSRVEDLAGALQHLSPALAVAGLPVVVTGLLLQQRLDDGKTSGGLRTAATGVGLAGMLVLLGAVALAWPHPLMLPLVCAADFAALTYLAFRFRMPLAHAAALPCLALGCLTGYFLLTGQLSAGVPMSGRLLAELFLSPAAGTALAAVVLFLTIGAEALVRWGRREHALVYSLGGSAVAVFSLLLLDLRGLSHPGEAALIHLLYGVTALAANVRWRRLSLSYSGYLLILTGTLWLLYRIAPGRPPFWGLVLALEALALALLAVWHGHRGRIDGLGVSRDDPRPAAWHRILTVPCHNLAYVAMALALLCVPFTAGFPAGVPHTCTALALAAATLLLVWVNGWSFGTWLGAVFLWAAMAHALVWDLPQGVLQRPWLMALLAHSSLLLAVRLLLGRRAPQDVGAIPLEQGAPRRDYRIHKLFEVPIGHVALVGSAVSLLVMLLTVRGETLTLALYVYWLAALWLAFAWTERSPGWFTAFQAVLAWAVLLSAAAWVERQPWGSVPVNLGDPRTLQAFGVALALLSLVWIAVRIGLRSSERAVGLMSPAGPALDRLMLAALVPGQLALALVGVWPGVVRELTPRDVVPPVGAWSVFADQFFGPGAWLLLAALAVVLCVALWERGRLLAVVGLMVLALTVPVLCAGLWQDQLVTASALRWGLAFALPMLSAALWLRGPILDAAKRAGIDTDTGLPVGTWLRGLVVGGTAGPVILLTAVVAVLGFSGLAPSGPGPDTFFARVGWVAGNVVPLALVCLGLSGHALRERSAGYAFAGGLVALVAVVGGHALAVVMAGEALTGNLAARLLQLGSLAAAVWALGWLGLRTRFLAWREVSAEGDPPPSLAARPLMLLQFGMTLAGNAWLLLSGALAVVLLNPSSGGTSAWATAVGSPWGWAALFAALAAVVVRQAQHDTPLSWHGVGLGGAALLALLTCTAEALSPGWGYRTLMLVSAAYALLWSLGQFIEGRHAGRLVEPFPSATTATPWVTSTALLAIALALKAAFAHGDWLWAAGAVGLASAAYALLAFWVREERWAFAAGLGVNLAASLVVLDHFGGVASSGLWVALTQANVLASAAVAFLWLLADRRFGVAGRWRGETPSLLAVQSWLPLAGQTLLLLVPLTALLLAPARPLHPELVRAGHWPGWLAWLAALGVAIWYAGRRAPQTLIHAAGIGVLSLGVLAACVGASGQPNGWLSYHVLTCCWTVAGLAAVGLAVRTAHAPAPRAWAEGLLVALVVLGLRAGWTDPLRPYLTAGPVFAATVMAAALALARRTAGHVAASGILLTLGGGLIWIAWGPGTLDSLALTVVLGLAAGALFWAGVDLRLSERLPALRLGDASLSYQHLAARLAVGLLATVVGMDVLAMLVGAAGTLPGVLCSAALLTTSAAVLTLLWDPEARHAPRGLYVLGLTGIALVLDGLALTPARYWQWAALALAGYVLLTSVLGSRLSAIGPWLPSHLHRERPRPWFYSAQIVLGCAVLMLSLWLCLSFASLIDRLTGPLALALLLPAGVFLVSSLPDGWGSRGGVTPPLLPHAALALGALLCLEVGWAWLEPVGAAGWFHHTATVFLTLTFLSVAYRDGIGQLLPASNEWAACGRRAGAVLGVLAALALLALLGQEFALYDKLAKRTPLAPAEVWLVVAGMLTLGYLAIRAALEPDLAMRSRHVIRADDVGTPENRSAGWRTLYVYGTELLLVFLFLHIKWNVPHLFGHWGGKWWPVLVMVIAFVGVGLAELFERRGLAVLSGPLFRTGMFLPLLPLLVFWLRPPLAVIEAAEGSAPGLAPLFSYLKNLPRDYDRYSLLWFILSGLYVWVALSRRKFRYVLLAALAANFGLWAVLAHFSVGFILHPQVWLIPLALIVLMSEHVNRDRLTREQGLTLRYAGLAMVYVSSTADLFIAGVGNSVVLPIVLAVLSVLGVLAGIMLRVRAFLFMGLTFLCLDVFAMIWHAAVDRQRTWIWYVSGIILGGAILALFALFEKRRNDVLRLIEEIKRWD